MRKINDIIIHCTATPEGREVTMAELRAWHRARGFADVGYHYLVHLDGTVEEGRPLNKVGAHCRGHNAHSIGIAYAGGCRSDGTTPADTRTPAQRIALRKLALQLLRQFPLSGLHGHNDYAAKACPSFSVKNELF